MGPNLPPKTSNIKELALLTAKVCKLKSTPRSNLVEASVCNANFLGRPLITSGLKKALSRYQVVVVFLYLLQTLLLDLPEVYYNQKHEEVGLTQSRHSWLYQQWNQWF